MIIPYYAYGEQSWMPFGVERQARFREISGDLEETILTPPGRLSSEEQCLSLAPINSRIELKWDVRSILWTLHTEKGSDRISYSGIQCGGLPLGTTMHGKREQALWRKGPYIRQMTKMCMSPLLPLQAYGSHDSCWVQSGEQEW